MGQEDSGVPSRAPIDRFVNESSPVERFWQVNALQHRDSTLKLSQAKHPTYHADHFTSTCSDSQGEFNIASDEER